MDKPLFILRKIGFLYLKEKDMVYIENIKEPQVVFIPSNGEKRDGWLYFTAMNTMDKEVGIEQEVSDIGTSEMFYNLEIEIENDIPDGEYNYTLTCDEEIISTGLMIVGDSGETRQYINLTKYEQYNA